MADMPRGATIIADIDEFTNRDLSKVGYKENPLEDRSLEAFQLHTLELTT